VKNLIGRSQAIPSDFPKSYVTDLSDAFNFCNDAVRSCLRKEARLRTLVPHRKGCVSMLVQDHSPDPRLR
jgi:hypothetical protein